MHALAASRPSKCTNGKACQCCIEQHDAALADMLLICSRPQASQCSRLCAGILCKATHLCTCAQQSGRHVLCLHELCLSLQKHVEVTQHASATCFTHPLQAISNTGTCSRSILPSADSMSGCYCVLAPQASARLCSLSHVQEHKQPQYFGRQQAAVQQGSPPGS